MIAEIKEAATEVLPGAYLAGCSFVIAGALVGSSVVMTVGVMLIVAVICYGLLEVKGYVG